MIQSLLYCVWTIKLSFQHHFKKDRNIMISSSHLISTSQLLSSGICSSASTVAEGYLNCTCTPLGCRCYICFLHVLFFLEDNHFICLTYQFYTLDSLFTSFSVTKRWLTFFSVFSKNAKCFCFFVFYQVGGGPLV